jgi:hypothetical protein
MVGILGIEYNQLFYFTVIVFACLSLFQRTRWWIIFLPRAIWIFYSQLWLSLFIACQARCDDTFTKRLLVAMDVDLESKTRKEIWHAVMGWKTKKQRNRETYRGVHKEREEDMWRGLVVPEDQQLPGDGERPLTPRTRQSGRIVESVAQPVKHYPGSVRGHGKGMVRHARYDSGSSVGSLGHASSGCVGSIGQNGMDGVDGQADKGQAGQCNGTIGRKKKRKNGRR